MGKIINNNRVNFMLSFFKQEEDHYEELEINGFWLVKLWNGDAKTWTVHIFTPETFKNYLKGKEQYKLF